MGNLGEMATVVAVALGVVGFIGSALVYLRANFVKERDKVRTDSITALRELASIQEDLCDAEIERLTHHHKEAHSRCKFD